MRVETKISDRGRPVAVLTVVHAPRVVKSPNGTNVDIFSSFRNLFKNGLEKSTNDGRFDV